MEENLRNENNVIENEWEEYMGPDIALKRVSPGIGNIAELKDIVKANIKVFLKEDDKEPIEILNNACFKIGEGDAVPGLELALRHSREKEILKAKCTWKFGFGLYGRPAGANFSAVPEKSDLYFDIEILEHIPSPESGGGSDIHCILKDVEVRKEAGNRWFAYGDFTKAGRCFSQGGKTGDSQLQALTQLDDTPEGKAGKQLLAVYLDCLNNLAACHLNLNDPFKARESCIRVLEMDPNNHRGLLRAGKASLNLHEYEESKLCLTKLLEIQEMELNQLETNTSIPSTEGTISINEPLTPETIPLKIEELKKGIITTKQWLHKVELAKKKYREREKGMATKIAKGLFVENQKKEEKKVENNQVEQEKLNSNTNDVKDNHLVNSSENQNKEKKEVENENNNNNSSNNMIFEKEEKDDNTSASSFQISPDSSSSNLTSSNESKTVTELKKEKSLTEIIVTWIQNWLSLIAPLLGVIIALFLLKNKEN